jgi:hypothetical protein
MSKRVAYQNGEEAIEVARLIEAFMHFRIEEARVNTMLEVPLTDQKL